MKNDAKFPPWLTFVSQAADHDPSLRLTLLNPVNNELTVFINQIIDMDEQKKPAGSNPRDKTIAPDP